MEKHFHFKHVDNAYRDLVYTWLHLPHVAEWFYGQGLQNTLNGLDAFLLKKSNTQYWLAFEKDHPFGFLITSFVEKPKDPYSRFCEEEGVTITLDMLIGDTGYLGKRLSHILIKEFLLSEFHQVKEVLIDPEATNTKAIHVYQKVGFSIIETFIPSHSPAPHYMMRLKMKNLKA